MLLYVDVTSVVLVVVVVVVVVVVTVRYADTINQSIINHILFANMKSCIQ